MNYECYKTLLAYNSAFSHYCVPSSVLICCLSLNNTFAGPLPHFITGSAVRSSGVATRTLWQVIDVNSCEHGTSLTPDSYCCCHHALFGPLSVSAHLKLQVLQVGVCISSHQLLLPYVTAHSFCIDGAHLLFLHTAQLNAA